MKKTGKLLMLITIALLSFLPMIAMAAGPGFGGSVNDGGGACVPIDGGLSMLVVAGVSYGAKLVAKNKKKKAEATATK
ncbi:MAG: hypothetical protein P4L41_09595 [Flavipsychrobacter sp.]|nr:hypothetical protein [Flavipsychrobacter sp.]